ncbi:nitrate reductase, partial [Asticcacaulis sp.]|uniref:nitrate reductase n=1 Tax=Asticcacaulis sp. TaxID=1872648 RepID=UPI003F7CAC3A
DQLASHMDFAPDNVARVRRFWNAPNLAVRRGLRAVDLFEAAADGQVKALWIAATNPAVSMPRAGLVREALAKCPLVIVSDAWPTDTTALADIVLPAAAWAEKDGTVTNSERVISRQRRMTALPGQVRPDWAIVAEVARRMNSAWDKAFGWKEPHEVFDEHAGLTAFENNGQRFLNLGGLTGLGREAYDALMPTRWPVTKAGSTQRLFADGHFATPNGRARLIAPKATGPANLPTPEFPFSLNSARVRDHWHTLTRTALAPELNRHITEPLLDIHPKDAKRLGIKDSRLAIVTTAFGEAILKARVTDDVREGNLSVPMHWTRQFAPFGRANALVNPAVDPMSGQPEFKHTPARVAAYNEAWHGFIMTPRDFDGELPEFAKETENGAVWRRSSHAYADCFEIAGIAPMDISAIEITQSLDDLTTGQTRRVRIEDGRLTRVLFIAPITKRLPPRDWLLERFGDLVLDAKDRAALLIGRLPGVQDKGRIICACRSVGEKTINAAIADGALTVEAIGEATTAGTACGSCKGELKQCLLKHAKETAHAV